ncbi:hypothetical protein MIR68_006187 [Amoeboaphelidium protococcarum]|nr:hypothetical protein MIR68_006187 [Amoeboaphelidium protococcarum]
MDSLFQQLAAVEQDIKGLIDQRAALKKVERKQVLDSDQQEELVRLDMRLADASASAKRYESFIKLAMKEQEPEAMTFKDADEEWTQSPRPGFHTAFEEIRKGVHQFTEAGRRFFLNLFLLDIIHRPEFEGDLRLFPELELSVIETTGAKKRKLSGRTDYTIGFGKGKDILSKAIPREVHLVAVEAKTSIGTLDLLQCIAEAATLYKIRVDARKPKKSVWGILSNAETWRFIFIDEAGLLWKCDIMPLDYYDESKVLQVYRMVYHMIKCCHEACTPPPFTASPVVSLNQ